MAAIDYALRRRLNMVAERMAALLGVEPDTPLEEQPSAAEIASGTVTSPVSGTGGGGADPAVVTDLTARIEALEAAAPAGGGGAGAPDALGMTDRVRWLDANGDPAAELWVEEGPGGARELRAATVSNGGKQIEGVLNRASDAVDLIWVSNGDDNGLFYYLGTNEETEPWQNPISGPAARVAATSSPLINAPPNVYGPDKTVDRGAAGATDVSQFHTSLGNTIAHCTYDLGPGWQMEVHRYTMRGGPDHNPRKWRLKGSNDGATWTTLKDHFNDTAIAPSAWAAWDVPVNGQWRYLRVEQYGASSSGFDYFSFSEIEFYGQLLDLSP